MVDLIREEANGFLVAAGLPESASVATRCEPWTVRDLTAHLASTVRRFSDALERSRKGDFTPPFDPPALSAENMAGVEEFEDDPIPALEVEIDRFLALVDDYHELMAHQDGRISVGLQMRFALNEFALHRDDIEAALGGARRPPEPVVEALLPLWENVLQLTEPHAGEIDPWRRILMASGRDPGKTAPHL